MAMYVLCLAILNELVSYRILNSGFGTMMQDSAMVIMWWNSDGSITLSQRTATGDVEPVPDSNPPRNATTYPVLSNVSESYIIQ